MSGILNGKVALVTGSTTGLGRAIVEEFARAGATGAGFDIKSGDGDAPKGWYDVHGDVTNEDEVAAVVAQVVDTFGRLDVVVANAGLVPVWNDTENIDLAEWDHVFAVNVRGIVATIKHCVPVMKDHGGSIIAMGSLNSRRAHGKQCLYTATKHAVLGIVRAAALDLGRYNIRVNALGPGPIATDALLGRLSTRAEQGEPSPDEVLAQFAGDAALGRMATASDVARATVFLASDLSNGMTGQILPVDAGLA
jgi:NAD(P)-dependent dehydrogenase (short-subunit alcohol dehydrogenase family)